MARSPIQRAVDICGGQTALARRLGVRQGHVWKWLHRTKRLPPERAIAIEQATDGAVTRQDLCPSFPWEPGRKTPTNRR